MAVEGNEWRTRTVYIKGKRRTETYQRKEPGRLLGEKTRMSTESIIVTDSNFNDTIKKHSLMLIDFWAPWCGPCRALHPTIEELTKEYAGKVTIGRLNVDENPNTAECFQVYSIPTMLIMKNGCEVDRIVGLVPKKHIEAVLSKHLG
jgi:thioredoxin 1